MSEDQHLPFTSGNQLGFIDSTPTINSTTRQDVRSMAEAARRQRKHRDRYGNFDVGFSQRDLNEVGRAGVKFLSTEAYVFPSIVPCWSRANPNASLTCSHSICNSKFDFEKTGCLVPECATVENKRQMWEAARRLTPRRGGGDYSFKRKVGNARPLGDELDSAAVMHDVEVGEKEGDRAFEDLLCDIIYWDDPVPFSEFGWHNVPPVEIECRWVPSKQTKKAWRRQDREWDLVQDCKSPSNADDVRSLSNFSSDGWDLLSQT